MRVLFFIPFACTLLLLCCAFRCQYDKSLDKTTSTSFKIVFQNDLNGKSLVGSRHNSFLFGKISAKADAKINAGFYDSKTGFLVYKIIINCKKNSWKTMYNKNKNKEDRKKWKEGKLKGKCPEGDFDLIGVVGCSVDAFESDPKSNCTKRAHFIFNGEILGTNTQKSKNVSQVEDIPISLDKATLFKANIRRSGVTLDREAFGNCFAFPAKYHNSCQHAARWVVSRSDSSARLREFGAWWMAYNVRCEWQDDPNQFTLVQDGIMPDGTGIYRNDVRGYKTCCCSYIDGFLDTKTCKVNKDAYSCEPEFLKCDPSTYNKNLHSFIDNSLKI